MTPTNANEPTHAYLANLRDLMDEKRLARYRLSDAFPRRTLIHIHPAGPAACKGKAHVLFRLSGEEVNWFTGPPSSEEISRYP